MPIIVVEPLYDSVEDYDQGLQDQAEQGRVPIHVTPLPKGFPLTSRKKSTKPLLMVTYQQK